MAACQVLLVPGFFGFSEIGAMNYFHRVGETLQSALERRGVSAEIVDCRTQATGSIPKRALCLLEQVLTGRGHEADELHFVGHSTGGLDVRLLLTPGVRLRPGQEEAAIAARTRTAISLATPHFGTPLVAFFTTLQGRNLLRWLTVMASSVQGRYTIFLAAQATALLAHFDDGLGRRDTLLDVLSSRVLGRLTPGRDDPLFGYLEQIAHDQGALAHLTPENMDLFNAAVADDPRIFYGCVVTAAPAPNVRAALRSLSSVHRATTYAIFSVLHTLSGREPRSYPYPSPDTRLAAELARQLPVAIDARSNDGVVPTLSQLHGELVLGCVADHLDVVGQFDRAGGQPYADWLSSGSCFGEEAFVALWERVAETIAAHHD